MVQGELIITDYCKENLKQMGFLFDPVAEWWRLTFPVLFWHRKPVLFCKVEISQDKLYVKHNVIDSMGIIYAPYYHQEFGVYGNYLKKIDAKIRKKFRSLGIVEKKKNGKYKNKVSRRRTAACISGA